MDIFFKTKVRKAIEAHYELGFPKFPKQKQFEMVFNCDFSPIQQLTKHKILPGSILDKYIQITYEEFKEYLLINFNQLIKIYGIEDNHGKHGFWISKNEDGYSISHFDRGYIMFSKNKLSSVDLIDLYSKVLLSNIPKFSKLNPF